VGADEIKALESERFRAMAAGDVAALERLLGDDLVYTHSSASLDTKASLIEGIRTKRFNYQKFERPVEEVRVYGESAVVTGQARIELLGESGTRVLNVRYTDVWVKQGDGWRMVAWQSTPIPA
jgi:uncharacterized protein (TIGR02246 family)